MINIDKNWCGLVEAPPHKGITTYDKCYELYSNLTIEENCNIDLDAPLYVFGEICISGSLTVSKYLICYEDIFIKGNLKASQLLCYKNIEIKGEATIDRCNIKGDFWVDKDVFIGDSLEAKNLRAGNNLEANGSIDTENYIYIGKNVITNNISAGHFIEVGGYIETDTIFSADYIKSGDYIKAGIGITSHSFISAKSYIDVSGSIFAGVGPRIMSNKAVTCSELRCGNIEYGELVIKKEGK